MKAAIAGWVLLLCSAHCGAFALRVGDEEPLNGQQPQRSLLARDDVPVLFTNIQTVPGTSFKSSSVFIAGVTGKVPAITVTRAVAPRKGAALRFSGVSWKNLGAAGGFVVGSLPAPQEQKRMEVAVAAGPGGGPGHATVASFIMSATDAKFAQSLRRRRLAAACSPTSLSLRLALTAEYPSCAAYRAAVKGGYGAAAAAAADCDVAADGSVRISVGRVVIKKLSYADEITVVKLTAPRGQSFNRVLVKLADYKCGSAYFVKSTLTLGAGRPVPPKP